MLPFRIDHSQIREKILGESVRGVATDLRLIDLPDLVSYLKTGQIASVSTLVQASIELSFKPETLTFGHRRAMSTSNGGRCRGYRSTWNFTIRPSIFTSG